MLVVIWNEDNMSWGQGLVRAALGGSPGMKWITHIVAQREKKKDGQKQLVCRRISVTNAHKDKVNLIKEHVWWIEFLVCPVTAYDTCNYNKSIYGGGGSRRG